MDNQGMVLTQRNCPERLGGNDVLKELDRLLPKAKLLVINEGCTTKDDVADPGLKIIHL